MPVWIPSRLLRWFSLGLNALADELPVIYHVEMLFAWTGVSICGLPIGTQDAWLWKLDKTSAELYV